jgi:hypothetical protein
MIIIALLKRSRQTPLFELFEYGKCFVYPSVFPIATTLTFHFGRRVCVGFAKGLASS